jgi:hypothetical protein
MSFWAALARQRGRLLPIRWRHAYSSKESRPRLQPAVPMISAGRAKAPPRSVPSRYSRRWRLSPSSTAIEEEHQAHTPSDPAIEEA